LNAFITVTAEQALQQARQAETEIQRGHWRGPSGPSGAKDLIDTAGIRTTAASAVFKGPHPSEDASRRMLKAAARYSGAANMHRVRVAGTSYLPLRRGPQSLNRPHCQDRRRIAAAAAGQPSVRWVRPCCVCPPPGCLLRCRRIKTHVWASQHPRKLFPLSFNSIIADRFAAPLQMPPCS
jgi:hypothetical protein